MEPFLILCLAALSTLAPFWIGQRFGAVSLISPMHLVAYFCAMGFLIKVLAFVHVPELAFYARYIDTPGALMTGALYLSLFIGALCLGYRVAVRPFSKQVARREARIVAANITSEGWLIAASYAVVAMTVALLLRARGVGALSWDVIAVMNADKQINVNGIGVGSTLAGIKTLFIVPKCAFVLIFAKGMVRRDRRLLAHAAMLAGLLVFVALISGDRFELVELLAYATATYLILGGRVRPATLAVTGAAAVSVLLLSAYMTQLRGSEAGLLYQIVGSTYFLDINASVMVTDRVTPPMLFWGETYGWWSFGWVPRAIWVDKPAIDLGVFLKRDVMGITTGGAFNVTGPGEAFINFGWAGVLFGFPLGWVFRRVEAWVLDPVNTLRHGAFILYPLLVYPFVQATLQSSFSAFIVGAMAQLVLIFTIILWTVPRFRVRRLTAMERGYLANG